MTLAVLPLLLATLAGAADDRNAAVEKVVNSFVRPGLVSMPIGVTRKGTSIWCVAEPSAFLPEEQRLRSVILAGVDGDPETVEALRARRDSPALGTANSEQWSRAWIPIANPDAWYDCAFESGQPRPLVFPPRGSAYNTPAEQESAILCRFLEWFAPDAVVEVLPADDPDLRESREKNLLIGRVDRLAGNSSGWDVANRVQLPSVRIPAGLLKSDPTDWDNFTRSYTNIVQIDGTSRSHSPVSRNAIARLQRPPLEVARRLLDVYGHKLNPVMYQPALALMARLEFADQTGDAQHRQGVETILTPYLTGERSSLDEKSGGSHFAGQLIFAAWAHATGDKRAIPLVKAAADRGFDANGQPREAMPTHSEMSDAVFMACPILCEAGVLSGDPKYIDFALQHLKFMQGHCLRDDGLYRHSPLCETPWGRGNGFPALGLALSLSALQPIVDQPHADTAAEDPLRSAAIKTHAQMLASYRAHLQALLAHQDPTRAWRQVVDHPGSYRELTATCMMTFAIARGLRMGWLDEATYRPVVDRSWRAISLRVYDDGVLIDVCTGTGKQKSLQDYLDREAILGRDERGGAMALIAAVEIHRLQAEHPSR
ncbi:MAG: glycoside hydrolase family 88 protein [Planctomycetaceae bacterium]